MRVLGTVCTHSRKYLQGGSRGPFSGCGLPVTYHHPQVLVEGSVEWMLHSLLKPVLWGRQTEACLFLQSRRYKLSLEYSPPKVHTLTDHQVSSQELALLEVTGL